MTNSTSANRCFEDVRVEAVIVAELELGDVQRHVLAADLMERSDDAALDDRPETFNRLGVNCADHVLLFGMIDEGVRIFLIEVFVADPLIRASRLTLCETASCTKASRVAVRTFWTTRAITFPLRLTAPTIGVLPEPMPPVPPPPPRRSL